MLSYLPDCITPSRTVQSDSAANDNTLFGVTYDPVAHILTCTIYLTPPVACRRCSIKLEVVKIDRTGYDVGKRGRVKVKVI